MTLFSKIIPYALFLMFMSATVLADVKDPAWEKYVSSQREIQEDVYELAESQFLIEGEDASLFKLNRDFLLAMIEQKSLRYYYLFIKHPERIVRDYGFSTFIQFPWTESDETALGKENKSYRRLSKQIKKKKQKLEGDKNYTAMTEKIILLSDTFEYQQLEKRFFEIPMQVEKILAQQARHFSYHEHREVAQ
jgi:hypothetical protein